MKANDIVKEKAMNKLKEVKAKSEDSGSKAKNYLDGLLKIPFNIYKREPLLFFMKKTNEELNKLLVELKNIDTDLKIPIKSKFSSIELKKYLTYLNEEYIDDIKHKNIQLLKVLYTTGKRENLVINICYINNIVKKYSLKKNKICHSGKKTNYMKTHIITFVEKHKDNETIMNELILKFQNKYNIPSINKFNHNFQEIFNLWSRINIELENVKKTLDKSVHGHDNAKRQIERIIGQWINGEQTGYCFGFEGPPGVGKTSLAKNGLAKCLKDENGEERPFSFIALGGSSNGSTLCGHNYTYVGSTWGRIVDILMDNKCMNPIIFIDELDKVSNTEHGKEIIGILTHLVDPTQNEQFQDKYFSGVDLNLSKVLFIFSYNNPQLIDKILLDRIHRVKFKSLSIEDKIIITKKHILPELYSKVGLSNVLNMNDEIIKYIIENYTQEAGVRKLKEILFEIISEINLKILKDDVDFIDIPIELTKDDIRKKYLKDRHIVRYKEIDPECHIGVINGLWANSLGMGGIILIECVPMPSNNILDLKLTGMQGDVMKESMNVAKTLAWKLTDKKQQTKLIKQFKLTKQNGLHIHCPEGATPKDGPSAGTAITVCIYSYLNNKKINNLFAITGEIDLQGNVTAIGGLDLKILGGIRAGVKNFIFPEENEKDFKKFKDECKEKDLLKGISFYPVEKIHQVFELIFI
jgi:endopeptidase La